MTVDIGAISTGLTLAESGIWMDDSNHVLSYPEDGNASCLSIEEGSFWFRHRNDCIVAAAKLFPPPDPGTIFDIGGGNGFVSVGLTAAGFEVVLVEPGPNGASNARRRGLPHVVCAVADTTRFAAHSLPAAGLFDVIEHIEDDHAFLEEMRQLLVPGGRLYATVPAHAALWSEEDAKAGHFRRYTRRSLSELFKATGFEIEFLTYFFAILPLPIFLRRTLLGRLPLLRQKEPTEARDVSVDHAAPPGMAGSVLQWFLTLERQRIETGRPIGFGASCLIVARSPSDA